MRIGWVNCKRITIIETRKLALDCAASHPFAILLRNILSDQVQAHGPQKFLSSQFGAGRFALRTAASFSVASCLV